MKNFLALFILFIGFGPFFVQAAELSIISENDAVAVGEEFEVSVVITSSNSLNAVEGTFVFPLSVELKEVRDGNSVITFWVERPTRIEPGAVTFSGITPGGFRGSDAYLFSLVFEPSRAGEAAFALRDMQVLRNDGLGTEEESTTETTNISIQSGEGGSDIGPIADREPPETFRPLIAQDAALFEGKYFIAFATQDKASGMHHYEVKEYRFLPFLSAWKEAESPYVLEDQGLRSAVLVKAVDIAGNERVMRVEPESGSGGNTALLVGILLVLFAFVMWKLSPWRAA